MVNVKSYAGKILLVDLTDEVFEEIEYSEEFLRKYLGGTALGAKILYEMVPPNIKYDDPKNIVFIGAGPLTGTSIGGSGSISIVTKGALTEGATSSQANGLFGAYMKFSGYDGVILTGKAAKWRYLMIKDGKAMLIDASDIIGLDTYEVTDKLRELQKAEGRTASVLSIGPAGENKVRWAGTFIDHGHSASHNGTGAVIGSKRLKAIIAFRGQGRINVYDRKTLVEISQEMYEDVEYFRGTIGGVANMWKSQSGALPVKNYSTYDWDIKPEEIEKFVEKKLREEYQIERVPCWACRLLHATMFEIKDGSYKCKVDEPEYEQLAAWGPVTGITNVEAAMMLSGLTDRLGFDNNEAVLDMIERIAHRKDKFAHLLGEGVKIASEEIGGGSEKFAIHVKGLEPV